MLLRCKNCANIVAETCLGAGGEEQVRIRLAVRGRERRVYLVSALLWVQCERCGQTGAPQESPGQKSFGRIGDSLVKLESRT